MRRHKGEKMSHPSPPPGSYQIDVVDQVGRAYRAVLDNAQLMVEMALLPFLIVLGVELLAWLLPGGGMIGTLAAGLVRALGFLVFGTVFVVRWHRFVLLGESVADGLIPPGWTPYFIAGLKVGGLVFLCWIGLLLIAWLPPQAVTIPLALCGGVALGFVAMRVSLIFPAAAIEQPVDLRTAWGWIQGNYWRLFACVVACSLPVMVVQMIIGRIGRMMLWLTWGIFEALSLAVSFVGAALIAALLSHLYLAIVGGVRQMPTE
jgi:hypothetical protein